MHKVAACRQKTPKNHLWIRTRAPPMGKDPCQTLQWSQKHRLAWDNTGCVFVRMYTVAISYNTKTEKKQPRQLSLTGVLLWLHFNIHSAYFPWCLHSFWHMYISILNILIAMSLNGPWGRSIWGRWPCIIYIYIHIYTYIHTYYIYMHDHLPKIVDTSFVLVSIQVLIISVDLVVFPLRYEEARN